jgi:hypothetical protein
MDVNTCQGRDLGARRSRVAHPASTGNDERAPGRRSPFGQVAGRACCVVARLAQAYCLGGSTRLAARPASHLRTSDFSVSLD